MLRLLADQLDRPTPKHLTPALGFGFAVDGWNRAFESFFTLLRSIAKKCDSGQSRASIEGTTPYIGYTIRDRDARQAGAGNEGGFPDAGELTVFPESDSRQAGAAIEGIFPDAGNAVRNHDARQAGAVTEGITPDAGDAVGDCDARQARAFIEGITPDAGDAVGDRDARQAAAVPKGVFPDAGNAVRNRDSR